MTGYRERAKVLIEEERPIETTGPIMRKLVTDARATLSRGPADARKRAQEAREYAVEHLEELHEQLQGQLQRRGVGYHRATGEEDAVAIVRELLGDDHTVAKSKSMVAEEIGLTHALREDGLDILETDIGEYIVDREGRGPSHITAPALHLDRRRIQDLLNRTGATLPDDNPERLSRYVRDIVGNFFADCDAAITGANAVVASSGRFAIVENEGNVSLGVSHPRKHIIITGLEKVVADEAGALSVLEVLAPNATAQPLTSFTHFLGDPPPGQERHVVFVDNGRSAIRSDERYREVLQCIRCGACMNTCPVYRAAGGLSYGSPYMGPIGAVISPLLWRDGRAADLPFASSLCGACTEICPVGIPLHRMLLDLRSDAVEQGQAGSQKERAGWKAWAASFASRRRARLSEMGARVGTRIGGKLPGAGKLMGRKPPAGSGEHDGSALQQAHRRLPIQPVVIEPGPSPRDNVELFRVRAGQLGVRVDTHPVEQEGDVRLRASGAIASTGSVLLTGEAAERRRLLGAGRVIVQVPQDRVVQYPRDIEPYLSDGEALLLTGASRTADIEKKIVRGIHGSEELLVELTAE